jgi:threonine-phosphate decarboxylase
VSVGNRVRPEVRAMARPKHGGDVWGYRDIKDYSSNVNPLGAPPKLNEYIMEAAADLTNYPDDSCADLKAAISERYGIPADSIVVGAGSAEIIRLFPEVFVRPGDAVVMPRPTFSEYGFACRLMGARMVDVPLDEERSFRIDTGRLISAVGPGTKAVYLCNPNNPTGLMIGRGEVMELVEEAARRDAMVFLDETLLELSERDREVSCVDEVGSHDNLFIIRSFTKSFAMPGLRIGYGFGSREVVRYLDAGRLSWNLGTIEQRVAARLMRDERGHVRRAVDMLVREKERMHTQVSGILPYPIPKPDSYFFFCPVHRLGITSSQFRSLMLERDVLVRDCSSFGPPCERYSRFCVKTPDKNDEFLEALRGTVDQLIPVR